MEDLKISDKKILITVINNNGVLPSYFTKSLLELYIYTRKYLPGTDLRFIEANSVAHMRNLSVRTALEDGYDYLVQLDSDQKYPANFIVKFYQEDKEVITGCTNQRVYPFYPTQYFKLQKQLKELSNLCFYTGEDELIEVEASGPVGMLVKTSVFKKMKWPYYSMDWSDPKRTISEDIRFCMNLKELDIPIYLDMSINFPHEIKGFTYGRTLDLQGIKMNLAFKNKPKGLKDEEVDKDNEI